MKNPILINLQLTINFGNGIPLIDFEYPNNDLRTQGVYCIREGECETFDPLSTQVKYIGKAISESIASRCQKHFWSITNAHNARGNPKTKPGNRFKEYRETRQFNPDGLYVFPGIMTDEPGYLVSFAEEYLIYNFKKSNGCIPEANTKS